MSKSSLSCRSLPLHSLKTVAVGLVTMMILSMTGAQAGTEMASSKPVSVCSEKDWTIELGSGVDFSNVRRSENCTYTEVPIDLTAALKLDDVSLDNFLGGWLRGYSEFTFRANYTVIASGPETYQAGMYVAPRYNFVQPGWKVIPFIEGGVGFLFSDSNSNGSQIPGSQGLGQDFNFSFEVAAGVRYDFCKDWFTRVGVEYRHVSNAGLSEPQHLNNAIDSLGPRVSVGYSF